MDNLNNTVKIDKTIKKHLDLTESVGKINLSLLENLKVGDKIVFSSEMIGENSADHIKDQLNDFIGKKITLLSKNNKDYHFLELENEYGIYLTQENLLSTNKIIDVCDRKGVNFKIKDNDGGGMFESHIFDTREEAKNHLVEFLKNDFNKDQIDDELIESVANFEIVEYPSIYLDIKSCSYLLNFKEKFSDYLMNDIKSFKESLSGMNNDEIISKFYSSKEEDVINKNERIMHKHFSDFFGLDFEAGESVLVLSKEGDVFENNFHGTLKGFTLKDDNILLQVEDKKGNMFLVDYDQITNYFGVDLHNPIEYYYIYFKEGDDQYDEYEYFTSKKSMYDFIENKLDGKFDRIEGVILEYSFHSKDGDVIYSEKLKEDILSEVKEKYDSFIMIDNKNNWDVLGLNSLIESFEGDKLEFKNFIQKIMKIFEFYYTSPQAQELSDGGILSHLETEYIIPKIFEIFKKDIEKNNISSDIIYSVRDQFQGELGINILTDKEYKKIVQEFINNIFNKDFTINDSAYTEFYSKDGKWLEIMIREDEDNDAGYVITIDEFDAYHKIKSTRDCNYEEIKINNSPDVLEQKLLKYLGIHNIPEGKINVLLEENYATDFLNKKFDEIDTIANYLEECNELGLFGDDKIYLNTVPEFDGRGIEVMCDFHIGKNEYPVMVRHLTNFEKSSNFEEVIGELKKIKEDIIDELKNINDNIK